MVMLGKRVYKETVKCIIPPGEPRNMGRQSPQMLCLVYYNLQGDRLSSLWMDNNLNFSSQIYPKVRGGPSS